MNNRLFIPLALLALTLTTACGTNVATQPAVQPAPSGSRILVAYFSRYGNTDYPASVDASTSASIVDHTGQRMGTTELMARDIQAQVQGDLFLIQSEHPYPQNFDDVVDQNHQELASQAFPALTTLPDLTHYDVIFLGYPVWTNTIPRPVATFIQQAQLAGKIVIPFCTNDGYRSGRSYSDIKSLATGATVLDGIDIEASKVPTGEEQIKTWLNGLHLDQYQHQSSESTITVNGQTIHGQWEDTPLAQEIRAKLPLTVSMLGYGGREYYGPLPFTPSQGGKGKRNFENGDITYCPQNNTIAIFYAQTDRPDLTMDVIKIGKVTDDLAIFDQLGSTVSVTFT